MADKNEVLRKSGIFIFVVAIVCVCVAAVYMVLSKPKYGKDLLSKNLESVYAYAYKQYMDNALDNAIKGFETVLKDESPQYKDLKQTATLKLAEIYEKKGYFADSRRYFEQYIEKYPDSNNINKVQNELESLNMKELFSPAVTKDDVAHKVKEGDSLGKIARDYGTTVELIKRCNSIKNDVIIPGQVLKIVNGKFSVFVDKSQNILYLKKNGEIFKTYTVATGENNSTPVGDFKVEEKLIQPVWYRPGTAVTPDAAEYELGTRWMGLSIEGYGIHGTSHPETLGKQVTKGCVRMRNADVEELFDILPSGTEVTIVD